MSEDAAETPAPPTAKAATASRNAGRRYAAEALRDHQPRLLDFIPVKLPKLLLVFSLGIVVLAGIEAAYATRVLDVAGARLPTFDLAAEGSLNNWFTSIALDLAGIVALVIYSLRRHRLDDYHGRYRVWLWAAACWLWLSVDEAACLHESLQAVLAEFAGQSLRETEFAWVGLYLLAIGAVALRLVFEMRPCRAAIATFVLAGASFVTAAVAHFGWLPATATEYTLLIEEGCEMGGSLLVLFAMCLYARYVILDAQGLIAVQVARKEAPAEPRRGLWGRKTKVDQAHTSVRPSSKRSDLESVPARNAIDDEDDEDDEDGEDEDETGGAHDAHRLSKSERKALRRQQERQRKQRLG